VRREQNEREAGRQMKQLRCLLLRQKNGGRWGGRQAGGGSGTRGSRWRVGAVHGKVERPCPVW